MDRFTSSLNDFKRLTTIMNQVNDKAKEILEHNRNNLHESIKFTVEFDQKMNDTLQICDDLTKFLSQSGLPLSIDDTVASTSSLNQLQEAPTIPAIDIEKCMSNLEVCSSISTSTGISTSPSTSVSTCTSTSTCSNEDEHVSGIFHCEISNKNSQCKKTTDTSTVTSIPKATLTSTSIYTTKTTPTSTITLKCNVDRQPHVSALGVRDKTFKKEWSMSPSTSYPDMPKIKRSIFTTTTLSEAQDDQELSSTKN